MGHACGNVSVYGGLSPRRPAPPFNPALLPLTRLCACVRVCLRVRVCKQTLGHQPGTAREATLAQTQLWSMQLVQEAQAAEPNYPDHDSGGSRVISFANQQYSITFVAVA